MLRATRLPRAGCILAAGVAIAIASAGPAPAQGFFDFFGNMRRSAPPPPPQIRSFVDPFGNHDDDGDRPRRRSSSGDGGSASYCVRLCDGRYFPLPRSNADGAQICQSLCPATKTKVFSGSGIDSASANDGARYADLHTAFLYRDKLVAGCTCNGRSPAGLASVEARTDPTLRAGDIVATPGGLMAYQSGRRNAEFSPIDRSVLSKEWRSKLSAVKIEPVREEAPSEADLPKSERRGTVSR